MGAIASIALPIAGGVGGFMLGGGIRGVIMGATLGSAAYNMLGPRKHSSVRLPSQEGPRLADLRVQLSAYGQVIPKLYGTMRLAGNVIWSTDIKEHVHEHTESFTQSGGGKGGSGRRSVTTTQTSYSFTYSVTLAIALCEGVVDEITQIWADSKLLGAASIGSDQGKFNVHLGTEDQLQDDIIARYKGNSDFPAYRGLCYVVIEDFPLEEYGNKIPNFSFEVRRTVRQYPAVEDKIRDVILIPGSGEFVYADQIHYYTQKLPFGGTFGRENINMQNFQGKANVLLAIDQLQQCLPSLEWVGLVVTWFATSTDAGSCNIIPKVEFKNEVIIEPHAWSVAGYTRDTAEEVLRFDEDTPTYGGTPSDHTVISICQELRERGLKIMLYPMIFVDELEPNPKPWRGRITANNSHDIDNWFTGTEGYNRFIMHYAGLTQGLVDAFVIGSEMVSLTGFTDRTGNYPAVNQFIALAHSVKNTVRGNTLVTYAADWSEYHHTEGGWFNLDSLWACSAIDFVGIDAYFPLTKDLPQNQITEELIRRGWESGEGWDYYCTGDQHSTTREKHDFYNAKYTWKNLEYWWSNTHTNPDGSITPWQAKMKPVWFTELGFPSVDGCSNQPNVFYDPSSSESYFPRGSKGRVDFFAQRQALNATLDYLEERCNRTDLEELVPRRFVWTWDARPFPAWPDYRQIWQDGILWPTGHWINGKLGRSNLAAIVAELLVQVGLQQSDFDTGRLTDTVDGYIISQHITAREAIEQLQAAYFFDAVESDGILKFIPRKNRMVVANITEAELVPSNNQDIKETVTVTIAQELELPQKISITHIDKARDYDQSTIDSQRQTVTTSEQINISLPLSMSNQDGKKIADITLYNAWEERKSYQLTLPPKYAHLEPTDIIAVTAGSITHIMRIIKTDMQRTGQMKLEAVHYNADMYDFHSNTEYLEKTYILPELPANTWLELIEAPPLPTDENRNDPLIRAAIIPSGKNWSEAVIYKSLDDGYDYKHVAVTNQGTVIGLAPNLLPPAESTIFDLNNTIIVQLFNGDLYSTSELSLLNGDNAALISDELIQFQYAELIDENTYKLSKLLRGRQGTEWAISKHKENERFVLINSLLIGKINTDLIGRTALYKPVSVGSTLAESEAISHKHSARNLKPFAPVHTKATIDENDNINISWIRRGRHDNGWRDYVDVPLGEESEHYEIDIIHNNQVIETITTNEQNIIYNNSQNLQNLTANIYQLSAIVGRGYGSSVMIC